MQFNQIPADEIVKDKLKDLVRKNRLSHALLFLGKEGGAALSLAISLAQFVLCERVNKQQTNKNEGFLFQNEGQDERNSDVLNDSCGECSSCLKVSQLMHPDVHFSYPALKRDSRHDKVLSTDYIGEWRDFVHQFPYNNVTDWLDYLKEYSRSKIENPVNKQGNISAFECDDISRKLSLKSFESSYKILIMWMPEYLGKEGNKLLKLIEEPPANTLFILVAENEESILPTILSRTQVIRIPSFTDDQVTATLIHKYQIQKEKAVRVAAIVAGNLREALLQLQNSEDDFQSHVRNWLNLIMKNKVEPLLKWIDEINKLGREKQKELLKYFVHLLAHAVRSSYIEEQPSAHLSESHQDFCERINKFANFEAKVSMIEELEKAIYYIERNANARMLFHSLSIRFFHIIKDNSVILVN
ncbi:MAG: ATP-binding protein [Ginsengibacter sp.]